MFHWHLSVSKDHKFAPIVQRLLWLSRPIREWRSLSHLEHVKAIVGLLARPGVGKHFLRRATLKTLLLSGGPHIYFVYFNYNLQRMKI